MDNCLNDSAIDVALSPSSQEQLGAAHHQPTNQTMKNYPPLPNENVPPASRIPPSSGLEGKTVPSPNLEEHRDHKVLDTTAAPVPDHPPAEVSSSSMIPEVTGASSLSRDDIPQAARLSQHGSDHHSEPLLAGSSSIQPEPTFPFGSSTTLAVADGGHDGDHNPEQDGDYDSGDERERAAAQAEDGAIEFDGDEMDWPTESDPGYESDARTRASTSLASSVRDYVFENGRRYHRFREGRYNFPNDEVEQEREDMKHQMLKMLCQRLAFAPIGDNPHEVLDIGTGTGMWAIEMADEYPTANVLGIDLSPHQPDWVPPNVKFMVDDVESPWLHPRNHFDYIHSRHTVMAIKDWPRLFRRALEHLRPGGWMEMQEIVHYPVSSNNTMPADHPVAQYWGLISEGLNALGIDFQAASGGKLKRMMEECGFVNVTEKVVQVPLGTWPKNRVLKTVGLYWRTNLLDGIQAIALGPLTRGCKWSPEQVEVFLVQVRKAYMDNSCLMYMPLHIVYGQKPYA